MGKSKMTLKENERELTPEEQRLMDKAIIREMKSLNKDLLNQLDKRRKKIKKLKKKNRDLKKRNKGLKKVWTDLDNKLYAQQKKIKKLKNKD